MTNNPFERLGIPRHPVMLAPLAGVSDHPFRRLCAAQGADLTYVEMISATALIYESRRTHEMLCRHESEKVLGVQVTGRSAEDTAKAFEILDRMPFDTIDINMGCPVAKVVKTGCGSAILKDPQRVLDTVKHCRSATNKPFSVKIRLGWDRSTMLPLEVADAAQQGGADWLVVHGRTRSDDYSVPVDLEQIARIKSHLDIPVIGNGNIFGRFDGEYMRRLTKVDGVMVSRGALGDPWVFRRLKQGGDDVGLQTWVDLVAQHLVFQQEAYGDAPKGVVCMRKHILWYLKGWQGSKSWKDRFMAATSLAGMSQLLSEFHEEMVLQGQEHREVQTEQGRAQGRFNWDPKWEMDRKLDRGVGDDLLS